MHPILTECRVLKSDMELALIQFANDISSEAHVEVAICGNFSLTGFSCKNLNYSFRLGITLHINLYKWVTILYMQLLRHCWEFLIICCLFLQLGLLTHEWKLPCNMSLSFSCISISSYMWKTSFWMMISLSLMLFVH